MFPNPVKLADTIDHSIPLFGEGRKSKILDWSSE